VLLRTGLARAGATLEDAITLEDAAVDTDIGASGIVIKFTKSWKAIDTESDGGFPAMTLI
jgi:hypothetical protein